MDTDSREEVMDFQRKYLESWFSSNASEDVKRRREEKKMTMDGCLKWTASVILKKGGEGTALCKAKYGQMGICTNEFVFDQCIYYFSECEEGDEYMTEDEIKDKEKRVKAEERARAEKAKVKWAEHAERVARWSAMTDEEIRDDIYRKRHPSAKLATHDDIVNHMAEEEARRKVREEEARKRAEQAAKRKAREDEKVRRQRIADEMAKNQMTFNF